MSNLSVNAIRFLGIDAINKANSGHPGVVMGAAPMAYNLFTKELRINPAQPNWINRDRFILSAGHGSMLLYALLHLSGFEDVSMDEVKNFRQWGSKTQGIQSSVIQQESMRLQALLDKELRLRQVLHKQNVS